MTNGYVQMLKNSEKLPIYTDLETLDIYCEYLLNDNSKHINFSNLTNLWDYVNRMDPKIFMTTDSKMARYQFIYNYLDAKLNRGAVSRKLCLSHVESVVDNKYNKIIKREILSSIEPDTLKRKDIQFINDMIFAQLNVAFMHEYKGPLIKMIEDLNTNSFGKTPEDCGNAIQFFQSLLNNLTKAQRRSKQENRFNLSDPAHFNAIMTEACDRLLSDSQYWRTGWVGFNKMIGGGLENARTYNIIGATGGFKSGLLLNIMKGVKKYNKGKAHKDPNKRPTVLFLSQENNIWETIARIFGIFGSTKGIKNFTAEEIMSILQEGGFTLVQDDQDIDIEFRYYGNMDIGVPDIRGICEELDNSGREVVCIIQDYIERLRPPVMSAEKRIQLFDVSNQLHDLAIDLDVPIVTGSQLNRSGVATIEDMRNANKQDIGKNVGSKDVSESFAMLKNFDTNISIVIEYDSSEERFYLSFRLLKFRGDDRDALMYFLQPFVDTNSKIQLMEDVDLDQPVYRVSMLDEMEASITDDSKSLTEISRKRKSIMDPIIDVETEEINNFINAFQNDLNKSTADQSQGLYRNNDGYLVLIRKPAPGLSVQVM